MDVITSSDLPRQHYLDQAHYWRHSIAAQQATEARCRCKPNSMRSGRISKPGNHPTAYLVQLLTRCIARRRSSLLRVRRHALKAGDTAPLFVLRDAEGKSVSSAELLALGPLIVSFYRGVWCSYCNMELQALQEALPSFRELGASLVAISPQNAANSRKSIRNNGVEFPILSDQVTRWQPRSDCVSCCRII
jgi:hypothetical protein